MSLSEFCARPASQATQTKVAWESPWAKKRRLQQEREEFDKQEAIRKEKLEKVRDARRLQQAQHFVNFLSNRLVKMGPDLDYAYKVLLYNEKKTAKQYEVSNKKQDLITELKPLQRQLEESASSLTKEEIAALQGKVQALEAEIDKLAELEASDQFQHVWPTDFKKIISALEYIINGLDRVEPLTASSEDRLHKLLMGPLAPLCEKLLELYGNYIDSNTYALIEAYLPTDYQKKLQKETPEQKKKREQFRHFDVDELASSGVTGFKFGDPTEVLKDYL